MTTSLAHQPVRRPWAAFALAFAAVIAIGVVTFAFIGRPAPAPVGSGEATGLGIEGEHFSLAGTEWTVAQASQVTDPMSTYVRLEQGDQQVAIFTGTDAVNSVAEWMQRGAGTPPAGPTRPGVLEYQFPSGIGYSWETDDGLTVAVTIGSASPTEAATIASQIHAVDDAEWASIVDAQSSPPTTSAASADPLLPGGGVPMTVAPGADLSYYDYLPDLQLAWRQPVDGPAELCWRTTVAEACGTDDFYDPDTFVIDNGSEVIVLTRPKVGVSGPISDPTEITITLKLADGTQEVASGPVVHPDNDPIGISYARFTLPDGASLTEATSS